jgi:hypothetical protein
MLYHIRQADGLRLLCTHLPFEKKAVLSFYDYILLMFKWAFVSFHVISVSFLTKMCGR